MGISWLDVAIAVYLGLHLITGYQQGLFLGGLGLGAFLAAVAVGVGLAPAAAQAFGGPAVLDAGAIGLVCLVVLKLLQGQLVNRLGPRLADHPRWQRVDRWLGLLPGMVWGALGAGLAAWFCVAFAGGLPQGSPLAGALLATVKAPLMNLGQAFPEDAPVVRPGPRKPVGS